MRRLRSALSTRFTCALLGTCLAATAGQAQPSPAIDLPTRVKEYIYAGGDLASAGYNATARYGNWVGEGWWGGSESSTRPGMLPPVDDLDRVAQRHDFGYQLAEELGRGRPGVTGTYMLLADIIAIRDTIALDRDPRKWAHPPRDAEQAKTFVKRLVIIFEDLQTRVNALHSKEMGRTDITDLETLDRVLDGLPEQAQFEAMQTQRVKQWERDYAAFAARKRAASTPAPTPAPAKPSPTDCTQGSFLDRTLCSHDPNAKAPKR